jgi:hypothetical protein
MGERGSDRIRAAQYGHARLRTVHTKTAEVEVAIGWGLLVGYKAVSLPRNACNR